MPSWINCTIMGGGPITVNLDHVATIRPHNRDRGGTGCEVVFVGGSPTSVVVKEDEAYLTKPAER
jgi:hypothetical protein